MPAQQHLEMLWKYILKNIFCFVLAQWLCRLCQMCLLPTALNEACDTPYKLFKKTDLISSYPFLCFSELFECPGVLLLSLKRSSSSSAFLSYVWNPPLPKIYHVSTMSPTSRGTVSSATGIQCFISSEFSSLSPQFRNCISVFQGNCLSWDLFKALVQVFI